MTQVRFTCPHCTETYEVLTFNAGWEGVLEVRCDRCPTTLYLGDKNLHRLMWQCGGWTRRFASELSKALKPCECGGRFRIDAQYRCSKCQRPIDLRDRFGTYDHGLFPDWAGSAVATGPVVYDHQLRDSGGPWDRQYGGLLPFPLSALLGIYYRWRKD